MITLKDISSNRRIGSISYAQLQFLVDELDEQHKSDQEYRINKVTLKVLKERGADAGLTDIIEKAMGDQEVVELLDQILKARKSLEEGLSHERN